MNLACLLPLIDEMPGYRQLLEALRRGGDSDLSEVVVLDAAKPYLLACLHRELGLPMLVVTARSEGAKQLQDQLLSWRGDASIQIFPEPDSLPYERLASDPSTVQQRIKALSTLNAGDKATLIIASSHALAQKTLSPSDFRSTAHTIWQGMRVNIEELLAKWQDMGYEWEHMVEVPGSFSRRGGIIDIYSHSSDLPARIELFGNNVESIRLFDPATQRSVKLVTSIEAVPAKEALVPKDKSQEILKLLDLSNCEVEARKRFEHEVEKLIGGEQIEEIEFYTPLLSSSNLLDYLPQNALLILDQPAEIEQALGELDAQARELRREQIARGELPQNFPFPYFTWKEFQARFQGIKCRLSLLSWQMDETSHPLIPFSSAPSYGGKLTAFLKDSKQMVENQKKRIIIVSHQARRLSELLWEKDIIAPPLSQIEEPPPPGAIALLEGSLAQGWVMDSFTLLTDAELFGFTKRRRRIKRHPMRQAGFLSELAVGDYVVHIEHGIARFTGTAMMSLGGAEREYLVLEYAAGDRLYVPSDQVDRVSRYIGPRAQPPALSRLGTQEWARAKQRVRQAAGELAKELLALYAAREVIPGFSFSPDTTWQEDLEASFPYMETPDQIQAVMEIKEDMERAKPMDRLVCGDVGYGKTEVALRAAFKAVMDGSQVAVLVPTTVLAQQHFQTFNERLGAFPVKVEVLSRFRSEREQQEVIEGLKRGTIDIVIGTHRLLQKDVGFKNLGLVVVDEEQRFGVAHKEHLKKMRKEVDVLTLTATPIPRTLHMSLSGVRDMSTMETPPEERLPIKTYIAEYDERLIREAILRELDRGGQVFFVHNRVQSIHRVASRLMELVPEAEITIGHGQMPEEQLESVMLDFSQGKIDILVSTTIIESGLDIPNVNTLIVNDADRLGLAQLYQLRGRVGRGANRAYAYFLYSKGKRLTPQAQRRLRTIFEATELGAGFRIAMRDLEIRGAGNLLGAEQSGHIGAVGFDLYCRLLQEAVEDLREGGVKKAPMPPRFSGPTIDLPMRAHIPEEYVSDLDTRLTLYQRLAKLTAPKQVDEMAEELGDRFGPMPPQVANLLYAVKVKNLAMDAGVESIATEDSEIVVKMITGKKVEKGRAFGDGVKAGINQVRLDIKRLGPRWQGALEGVLQHLCAH
ncbi:MAG: transcription-repair coupling factor [Dehalococcoidia bacterium]|nr:transcription-repair coupling factor [Dehalococcoidia bacterium]